MPYKTATIPHDKADLFVVGEQVADSLARSEAQGYVYRDAIAHAGGTILIYEREPAAPAERQMPLFFDEPDPPEEAE